MLSKSDILKLSAIVDLPPYAGKSDGEVSNLLETFGTAQSIASINRAKFKIGLIESGIYGKCYFLKAANKFAGLLIHLLSDRDYEEIDLKKVGSQGIMAGLLSEGSLTGSDRTRIISMVTVTLKKGEEILGQGKHADHKDIARARGRK